MRKFNLILGMFAVIASTLCVSCAQKKEPDLVIAPPRNRVAEYVYDLNGKRVWQFDTTDARTLANKWIGLWHHEQDFDDILRYTITPNTAWKVSITEGSEQYIQLRIGKNGYDGFIAENFELKNSTSGKRGSNTFQISVVKTPAIGEEPVVCTIDIEMGGESTTIATLTIHPEE